MKKILLLCVVLMLAACTATPTTTPLVPVTGDATPAILIENAQTGTVEANGLTIAYESYGSPENETILLIAGTGQQLVAWPLELVSALVERGYRVVRFDNRDTGLSTRLNDAGTPNAAAVGQALEAGENPLLAYTLRDMAQDTIGLLDGLGIEQVHLVGASMGGAISQWVALDAPERVLSLTTISADSGNPQLPVIADPAAFANVPSQPITADRAAFIEWQVRIFQVLQGDTYQTDEASFREWAERDFDRGFDPAGLLRQQTAALVDHIAPFAERWNSLPNIMVPTVIVQGTEDPLAPMASAEDLAARIPNAELRVIPGFGHFISAALIPQIEDAIMAAVDTTAQPPTDENSLAGSSWQLVSFVPIGATNPVIEETPITLEFGEDDQAGGHGGCSSYGGLYTVQNNSLQFGEIFSTLMECADQAATKQEQMYLDALRTASRFAIDADTLEISYQTDGGVLNFTRSSYAMPEAVIATTDVPSPADPP